ncbi:class I adenylate-forming enzyme family protein [Gemmata sp.]|uniref:class I adenylate-forming enzyme family protein n=1 Tax=Gemmata sp. TaxID=1914242 RepID=UPI003F6F6D3A
MDFSTILDESARKFGDRVALTAAGESLAFADLADRVARLAGGLAALGLSPGDRLATLVPNGFDLVATLLAAARAELISVPLPPRFAPPQIGYALRHSAARALVTTPALLANVPADARASLDVTVATGDAPDTTLLADLLKGPPAPPVRSAADPIGLLMYTSGTTSRPKGVAHSQRRMARRVDLFVGEMGLTAAEATLAVADAGRPAVLLGQVLPMLRVGGRTHLLPRPDPALFWAQYAAARPTYLFTPPGVAFDLLDHAAARGADHAALRAWVTGGDKAPPALHRRMAEVVGRPLLEMCGMTETGFYAINPPGGPIKVGSIGLAMRGVAVRLVAPDGNDVPPGEIGHIVVRTPDTMVGYWNDTLQTHRVLRDGWLDTGDLARADDDGYLWFVCRDKDMICRGGSKVAPAMVEEVLAAHPAVAAVAVVGVSDPRYGQVPFAFYRTRHDAPDPESDALRAWVAARLDAPSVPAGFAKLDHWPVTDQGKLDRSRLVWMAEAGGCEI